MNVTKFHEYHLLTGTGGMKEQLCPNHHTKATIISGRKNDANKSSNISQQYISTFQLLMQPAAEWCAENRCQNVLSSLHIITTTTVAITTITNFIIVCCCLVLTPRQLGVVVDGVTLSAGSHLDMSVIVTVQKNYTGSSCQASMATWGEMLGNGADAEKECLWRKCTQQVQYKVDLGYSKVRMSDRMPFEYPRGRNREMFVREKNRQSRMLAERIRRLNNDAFQPYLYYEFEKLIRHFYDGHSRVLGLFNLSMGDLIEERLSVSAHWPNRTAAELGCSKIVPSVLEFERHLVELVEQNWQFEWGRHNDDVTDITFFEAVKYRIPPSPIPMIEAYQRGTTAKQKLVDHTNQLFRLLLELWRDLSQNGAAREDATCRKLIADCEQIIKNEPLVARVAYSPVRSVLVRNLEVVLQSKNNMATLRFRFLSMTVVRMEESREYNNFNLLVDLGSTMGLYFGLTLLTLFELFIFFMFHNCKQPHQQQQKQSIKSMPAHAVARGAGGGRALQRKKSRPSAASAQQAPVVYTIPRPITVTTATDEDNTSGSVIMMKTMMKANNTHHHHHNHHHRRRPPAATATATTNGATNKNRTKIVRSL